MIDATTNKPLGKAWLRWQQKPFGIGCFDAPQWERTGFFQDGNGKAERFTTREEAEAEARKRSALPHAAGRLYAACTLEPHE